MTQEQHSSSALLAEFPPNTEEQWREAAEALLKGAPFEKVMTRRTPEGIVLQPIFRKEVLQSLPASETLPGFDGFTRGTRASGYAGLPWEISQELPFGLPEDFNKAARNDLMRGQNALNLLFDIATLKGEDPDEAGIGEVGGCGLSVACLDDLQRAFDQLQAEAIAFHLRSGTSGLALGALFLSWLEQQGIDPAKVHGSLGMDPLAVWAASGWLPSTPGTLFTEQYILARHCVQNAPSIRSIGVSTLPYHQAGASSVEELGIALATGVAYLREMMGRGLSVDQAARQIRFSFSIGPNFFMEMAKFRAIRPLWAQVVEAFGGGEEAAKMKMHARTGFFYKTRRDPYVNILRTTTEALSAVLGGVDSLCVGTFDENLRTPDRLSRRVARNIQIILQEECELANVVDPAGGSWAIEWLTDQIAGKSWKFFQEIEEEGGMPDALSSGMILKRIENTAADCRAQLNQRRISLVGTNVYPNSEETAPSHELPDYGELKKIRSRQIRNLRVGVDEASDNAIMEALENIVEAEPEQVVPAMIEAYAAGATVGEVSKTIRLDAQAGPPIQPMPNRRLASHYEKLRDASEAHEKKTGKKPLLFLCNLGPLKRHKLRAEFTQNFFRVGGFEIISPEGFESPEEAVSALKETGAGITVVCGADDDYAENFPAFASAIKQAFPEIRVLLAGHPGEKETTYREAGMDDYIFVKSDNYEKNRSYLEHLGVL